MDIKASEARKQWSQLLDRAVEGEVIHIRRGGVTFYLGTTKGVHDGQKRVVNAAVTLGREIEKTKQEKGNVHTPDLKDIPGITVASKLARCDICGKYNCEHRK
jgi:hypothetical protein